MLRRIWEWFFTPKAPATVTTGTPCPACTAPLKECPRCEGKWRSADCAQCRSGYLCTSCNKQWITH